MPSYDLPELAPTMAAYLNRLKRKHQPTVGPEPATDPSDCATCRGTGEGRADGLPCPDCRGRGFFGTLR